jgi:hypothetical protein
MLGAFGLFHSLHFGGTYWYLFGKSVIHAVVYIQSATSLVTTRGGLVNVA